MNIMKIKDLKQFEISKEAQKRIRASALCFRQNSEGIVWSDVDDDLSGLWENVYGGLGWNTGCVQGAGMTEFVLT